MNRQIKVGSSLFTLMRFHRLNLKEVICTVEREAPQIIGFLFQTISFSFSIHLPNETIYYTTYPAVPGLLAQCLFPKKTNRNGGHPPLELH